jgi:ribonuclease III
MISWVRRLFEHEDSPDNEQTSPSPLVNLADIIGVPITNETLFVQALKHRSLLRGNPDSHLESNERLEYLGDAVLGFVVAEHLYAAYPEYDEGFLTRLRAKLVNGQALADRARELGLGQFILVSESITDEQKNSDSILSDAFEAIIGAIYLDHGTEAASAFVKRAVLTDVDLDQLAKRKDNHKSILLEFVQARSKSQPEYIVVSESGPSHDKRFVVAVCVDGVEYGQAEDRSKKRAEQTAAKLAIEQLRSLEIHDGFKQS